MLHWMAVLDEQDHQGLAKYDDDALKTIVDDGRLSRTKRAAAASLLRLTTVECAKNGLPLANADLERLLDRHVGRPKQSIEVTRKHEGPSLPDVIKEARAIAEQLGAVKVASMIERMEAEQSARDNCRRLPGVVTPGGGVVASVDNCQAAAPSESGPASD